MKKTIVIFEISSPKFVNLQNFAKKQCLNFGPEMPYLSTFGLEFENFIFIFEISTLEFVLLQHFAKKTPRCLNLGLKNPYLRTFELEFSKNYCHI